ncbi:MAG: hypothetical protein EA359_19260 [Balneolaceae bacterium]|nr:MAG: hypothetical protein EA359_19260 [Balneolaceae bacterium]
MKNKYLCNLPMIFNFLCLIYRYIFGLPSSYIYRIMTIQFITHTVDSQNVKLLFDINHVQMMNDDVIACIKDCGTDLIGHVHTTGLREAVELCDV